MQFLILNCLNFLLNLLGNGNCKKILNSLIEEFVGVSFAAGYLSLGVKVFLLIPNPQFVDIFQ